MTGRAPLALLVGMLVLGGTVAAELAVSSDQVPALVQPLAPGAASSIQEAPAATLADIRAEHAAAISPILARPLFAPSRRPPAVQAPTEKPVTASGAPLPRLSGIMITGGERRAIFALPGAARPRTALAGEPVGAFTVETIETDRVVLRGAGGTHELRPSYANPPVEAAEAGPPRPDAFLAPASQDGIANAAPGIPMPGTGPDADAPTRPFTRGLAARLGSNRIASNRPETGR